MTKEQFTAIVERITAVFPGGCTVYVDPPGCSLQLSRPASACQALVQVVKDALSNGDRECLDAHLRPPLLLRPSCCGSTLGELGLGSTELVQEGRQARAEAGIPCLQFIDQTRGRHSQSPA
jgi:hypothetical protein